MTQFLSVCSRFTLIAIGASSLVLLVDCHAFAATKFWKNSVGSGNWNVSNNWSNASAAGADNGGVPALNDTVNVAPTDGAARTITYDVPGFGPNLTSLTVDLTNSAVNRTTLEMSANFVTVANGFVIGNVGRAQMNHSGGTLNNTNTSLDCVVGFQAGGNGVYNLSANGQVNVARDLYVGTFASSTGNFSQTGGSLSSQDLIVGNSAGSTGTFTASGGFTTLTGGLYAGFLGTGTLNVQGTATVSAATELYVGSAGTVNMSGGTLRFFTLDRQLGSTFNYTGGTIKLGGQRFIASDSAIVNLFGSTPTITTGKGLIVESVASLGGSGAGATVNVNGGAFQSLGSMRIGEDSGSLSRGTLNISNGATVTNAGVVLGQSSPFSQGTVNVSGAGTTWTTGRLDVDAGAGTLSITAGANVVSGLVYLGLTNDASPSTALVSGAGSTWTATSINLGNGFAHPNVLEVQTGGLVHLAEDLRISQDCKVILNGGTIRFNTYTNDGTFEFNYGTIGLAGNRTIGTDTVINDFFGVLPTISAGKGLAVDGTATISSGLTLNGGTLRANSLAVNGPFQFSGGLLELTGGAITGLTSLNVPTNGEFRASGVLQTLRVAAAAGSTITATGNLVLGDTTKVDGFYSNGVMNVGSYSVSLADANDAVFDSGAVVTLGAGESAGQLGASNGLTLDFGGNLTGFGTVITANDAAKPLINNGHITGNSPSQRITLPGYVKGVGTLDNVNLIGTYSPGLSPTTSMVGNLAFSPTSTLVMEIGGTSPGSQYDQIISSGQLGFDGAMQVSLINGFAPSVGQSFNLFDWTSVSGTFSTLDLPPLAGLAWNTSRFYDMGVLSLVASGLAGDFNFDGDVDGRDFLVWQRGGSPSPFSPTDLALWQSEYNGGLLSALRDFPAATESLNSGASPVPEPSTALILAAMTVLFCKNRPVV